MIKLIKTIVNEKRKLIGFVVEGKDKELDGFSNEKVQRALPLKVLSDKRFTNNQITFTGKGFQEKSNFKVNELPMTVMVNNNLADVSNKIAITQRFIQNNEPVGFAVQFGDGTVDKFTYPNVIQLSYWFKPENFVVRTSLNKKKFIAGKPGAVKLEDMPTTIIGEKPVQPPKRTKSGAQEESIVEPTGMFNNAIDLMDLYNSLNECDGLVIKLPDEEYKSGGKNDKAASNEFHALGVGEYAYPNLSFNETKINANTSFRKPGMVQVEFGPGVTMPVQSFTYNTKSIFLSGENHIKRFGVAMPKANEASFIEAFGKSLSIKPITNTQLIQAITSLTGKIDYVFYEVDTNKIDLISKSKLDGYILSTKEVKTTVENLFIPKLIAKFLSPKTGLIGELKKLVPIDHQAVEGKQPIGLYAGMNQDFRDKVLAAGIDIYSGAFTKTVKAEAKAAGAGKAEDDTSVNIEYAIEGYDLKKWTYKLIGQSGVLGVDLPKEVIDLIQAMEKIVNPEIKMKTAYELHAKAEAKVEALKKVMWLHKCAMYLKGNKTKIHMHDSKSWVLNTKKRTKAKVYNCTEPGCESLMVAVLNTDV